MSDEPSATETSTSTELKAGHAPAIKVGGMRVSAPRARHTSHGEEKTTESAQATADESATESGVTKGQEKKADEGDDNEQASSAVANRAAGELVGGTFVPVCRSCLMKNILDHCFVLDPRGFPTEAVKHIHDKPGTHPKHEFHAHNRNEDQRFINQPRKQ